MMSTWSDCRQHDSPVSYDDDYGRRDCPMCERDQRIRELEAALLPFANLYDICLRSYDDDRTVWGLNNSDITAGDIRTACALLGLPLPEAAGRTPGRV